MKADFWIGQGLGFVLGILATWLASSIARSYRRVRNRVPERHPKNGPLNFDPRAIEFFMLNSWSPARQLKPENLQTEYVTERLCAQTWCDPQELGKIRSEIPDPGGPAASLVDYEIDHRENERGNTFRMYLMRSDYADLLSVSEYFRREPEAVKVVLNRLADESTRSVAREAPTSVIAVNVVLLSADQKLLAIERSGAVSTSQNLWTLGPNETMNWLEELHPGQKKEDLFVLVERCLNEEVALESADYGRVYVSWIGYNVPGALVHVVALITAKLTSSEISERINQSHSVFEVQRHAWIRPDAKTLTAIATDQRTDGRKWIVSARLAAQEYWRFKALLLRDAGEPSGDF